ncbi:MAG TPA: insulinase family protein [Sandaracinaceae bacterium LLY-WYZ-13_1]|nr:insulinase family protein [Sandaracinaceae bacterium LLY-WYZ-13_1]
MLVLLATGCRVREAIPPPQRPLAATPAEALAEPPSVELDAPGLSLRLVRRELDNGLTIFVSRGAADGVVSVAFVDRSGGRWDPRAPAALTELTVDTLLRATRTVDGGVVDDLLERAGFTPEVHLLGSGWLVRDRILFEELPRYLTGLERSLRHPVHREADLRLVLDARVERRSALVLTPDGLIADRLPGLLYADGDRRAGSLRDEIAVLRGLGVDDLTARHDALLDPRRCAIVIAGDVEPLGALPLVRARFGGWEAGDAPPMDAPPPRHRTEGARGLVIVQPLVRTYLKLLEHAPPLAHEDHAAFLVLEQLLGGMFASRLNLVLREGRGISYGFHARYAATATEGELQMVTAIDPAHTAAVVEAILEELRRVRGEHGPGVRPFELSVAKTRAREQLLADLDHSLGVATTIGVHWLAGRDPEALPALLARLDALDADAVEAAARRWIRPDRAPIVAVGRADVVQALRAAGTGSLRVIAAPERHRR